MDNDIVGFIHSRGHQITQEQAEELRKSEQYLKKHKIFELFDELIAKLIADRPDDISEFLAAEIKKVKMNPKSLYFSHKDFDALFENYNILNSSTIPIIYLFQALVSIGIPCEGEKIYDKFPKLKQKNEITKTEFIDVLTTEYHEKLDVNRK